MDPLTLLALSLVGGPLVFLVRTRPRVRRGSLRRYARRVGLAVPRELEASVEQRLAARAMATELGALAGLGVMAGWAAITQPTLVDNSLWTLAIFGALFTGGAVGSGLVAARQAIHHPGLQGPRVARPRQEVLADFVAPGERQGAWAVSLLPAFILVGAGLIAVGSEAIAVGGVLAVGTVALAALPMPIIAGSEIIARRLLDQPQPAGSTLELAWRDALRAQVLRDVNAAPIAVGAYATFGMLIYVGAAARHEALQNLIGVTFGLLVLAAIGLAIAAALSRPHRHFLRQLWPSLDTSAPARGER